MSKFTVKHGLGVLAFTAAAGLAVDTAINWEKPDKTISKLAVLAGQPESMESTYLRLKNDPAAFAQATLEIAQIDVSAEKYKTANDPLGPYQLLKDAAVGNLIYGFPPNGHGDYSSLNARFAYRLVLAEKIGFSTSDARKVYESKISEQAEDNLVQAGAQLMLDDPSFLLRQQIKFYKHIPGLPSSEVREYSKIRAHGNGDNELHVTLDRQVGLYLEMKGYMPKGGTRYLIDAMESSIVMSGKLSEFEAYQNSMRNAPTSVPLSEAEYVARVESAFQVYVRAFPELHTQQSTLKAAFDNARYGSEVNLGIFDRNLTDAGIREKMMRNVLATQVLELQKR